MKILLDEKQLNLGVEELARAINEEYGTRPLTIVGVLTGSVVLMADLIRKLEMPLRVGVVQTSSYSGTERGAPSRNQARLTIESTAPVSATEPASARTSSKEQ